MFGDIGSALALATLPETIVGLAVAWSLYAVAVRRLIRNRK